MWLFGRYVSRWVLAALGVPVLLAVVYLGAWGVDQLMHRGRVDRNVTLSGHPIGGVSPDAARHSVEELAARFAATPVDVQVSAADVLEFSAGDLGLAVDVETTLQEAFDIGRRSPVWRRPIEWGAALTQPRAVPVHFEYDAASAEAALRAHPDTIRAEAVEPGMVIVDGDLFPRYGRSGEVLDVAGIVEALPGVASVATETIAVEAEWLTVPPRNDAAAIDALVEELQAKTSLGLVVDVTPDERHWIPSDVVREWVDVEADGDSLKTVWDDAAITADLETLLAPAAYGAGPPAFEVADGRARLVALAEPAMVCCAPEAAEVVVEAFAEGRPAGIALPLRQATQEELLAEAEALGIVELVAEFTTNHSCCQNRVTNIHRIADILRGTIIEPGGRFSVNETVGQRTRDKGFVAAGTIQFGRFVDGVGGGISQFATTLFNAAFFAGLDFGEYQSHSIYISRYPYGREATLSYPNPDLELFNNTPFGVMIWPTYTDSSITVQVYSTRNVEVVEDGQTRSSQGACTRVTTYRERVFSDGRVENDSVFAVYRPGEGLDCNGNPTRRPG